MIVVDASLMVEVVLRLRGSERLDARLTRPGERLCAPQLLDLEVLQAIRRYAMTGQVTEDRARLGVAFLSQAPLTRFPHEPLRERIWELRHNLTAYDGAYVALAEALRCPLLTADERLASSPGNSAEIEIV